MRYSPALANKPKTNKPKSASAKPFDPFEDPPPGLYITALPPSHFLVLNKFPVIPDHFILATTDFKQQTDLLEQEDLGAAYACLKAYREHGEELFGFFNSGKHSGASQPHRHIQFLPVASMRSGIEEGVEWEVLADALIQDPKPSMHTQCISVDEADSIELPFSYFSASIPEDVSPEELHGKYLSLHEQACTAQNVQPTSGSEPSSPISYNLGLIDRTIVLCPRTSEGLVIRNRDGAHLGPVALNGTVLGGTLLVKSEEEWDILRNDETTLTEILQAIGVAPTKHEHCGRL